jgi:DNA-binding response OmpR family regulator
MPNGVQVERHGELQAQPKRVVCVSWIASLALTRTMMLAEAGYEVTSIVGAAELDRLTLFPADLLVLAHSVPVEAKLRSLFAFRQICGVPVLSLLRPHQAKLPEADYAVEAFSPGDFLAAVKRLLSA